MPGRYGGTAVVAYNLAIPNLGVLHSADGMAAQVQRDIIFMPLIKLDAAQAPVPWLAERWDTVHISSDSVQLTFHLREDVAWHDGVAVQVLPGSHAEGRLSAPEVSRWREGYEPVLCTSARGGALLMRPLILHASSPATVPAHRRVVHMEFAAEELPHGLEWHGRW